MDPVVGTRRRLALPHGCAAVYMATAMDSQSLAIVPCSPEWNGKDAENESKRFSGA